MIFLHLERQSFPVVEQLGHLFEYPQEIIFDKKKQVVLPGLFQKHL